jgi:hypothetical protein
MNRKKYITPSLKTYGDVAQLTLEGGSVRARQAARKRIRTSGGRAKWARALKAKRFDD